LGSRKARKKKETQEMSLEDENLVDSQNNAKPEAGR
jgi:hypothetical protein